MGGDLAHVQVTRLVGEVDVEVDVHAEGGGQREHDPDVLETVAVVVRAAAHEIGAHRQSPAQQAFGARDLDDALLRERTELQVERRSVFLAASPPSR
jgi:hypothetical protein